MSSVEGKYESDSFYYIKIQNNNPRAWERLVRLRGHHGQQGIERSDEENIADFGYRDLAVFIWNDCGLTNITPEDVALVYNLVANSTMSIMVHGAEFQVGIHQVQYIIHDTNARVST